MQIMKAGLCKYLSLSDQGALPRSEGEQKQWCAVQGSLNTGTVLCCAMLNAQHGK